MTTSAYLALAMTDELFTTTDLLAAGLRAVLNIGRQAITYIPHDQPVSLDRPLVAYIEKQPANDNEKEAEAPEAKPATALAEHYAQRYSPTVTLGRLQPRLNHAQLKISHSEAAHGATASAPGTISIANRPFLEKLMSEKPAPPKKRLKPDAAA